MDTEETIELIGKIKLLWPSAKVTPDAAEAWQKVLENISMAEADKALDAYGAEGNKFAPQGPYDIKNRVAVRTQKEHRDFDSERNHIRYYLNQGLVPLVREHHGNKAFSWMKPDRARLFGAPREVRFFGISTTAYFED